MDLIRNRIEAINSKVDQLNSEISSLEADIILKELNEQESLKCQKLIKVLQNQQSRFINERTGLIESLNNSSNKESDQTELSKELLNAMSKVLEGLEKLSEKFDSKSKGTPTIPKSMLRLNPAYKHLF